MSSRSDSNPPLEYDGWSETSVDTDDDEDGHYSICQWCGNKTIRAGSFPGFEVVCSDCLKKHYAVAA